MAEYIERSAGVSILRAKANMAVLMDSAPYFEKAAQMLEKLPAADVAPVVYGEWIEDAYGYNHCSACGWEWDEPESVTPFCPNCGANLKTCKEGGHGNRTSGKGEV